jgi:hypothetical protein
VFGLVALASFVSGKILHELDWASITVAYLPLTTLAAGLVLMLTIRGARWGVESRSE